MRISSLFFPFRDVLWSANFWAEFFSTVCFSYCLSLSTILRALFPSYGGNEREEGRPSLSQRGRECLPSIDPSLGTSNVYTLLPLILYTRCFKLRTRNISDIDFFLLDSRNSGNYRCTEESSHLFIKEFNGEKENLYIY